MNSELTTNHRSFLIYLTKYLNGAIDKNTLAEYTCELDCDDYRQAYLKAWVLYSKGIYRKNEALIIEADNEVTRALNLRKQKDTLIKISILAEIYENGPISKDVLRENIFITPEILLLAGQIKATLGEYDNALEYYKKYQLYTGIGTFECPQQRLYLFRKCNEYAMKDLINNRLSIVKPRRLNDPVDCLIFPWRECLNNNCKEKKHIPFLAQSYDYYRIRSFALGDNNVEYAKDTVKNTLMWSHYADEHRGFCILYDFSDKFINSKEGETPRNYFMKVDYIDENVDVNKSEMSVQKGFATKSIDWKYENEVRLISYDGSSEEDFTYINLDEKSKIKAIFFGLRCDEDTIKTIKKLLVDKSIDYYQMELDYNNIYNLIPKRINNPI